MNSDNTNICSLCENIGSRVVADDEFSIAIQCRQCLTKCPDCQGEYYIDEGYPHEKIECLCMLTSQRIERFNAAKIPARYAGKKGSLSTFSLNNANLAYVYEYITRWLLDFTRNDDRRGILLYGAPGVGKTRLAVGILRELTLMLGKRGLFVDFSHMLLEMKEAMNHPGLSSRGMIKYYLKNYDVLLIDELGKGRGTDWELGVLDELISRAYNAGKIILATTNLPIFDKQNGNLNPQVFPYIPNAALSRLCEMTTILHVNAPDYRLQQLQEMQLRAY